MAQPIAAGAEVQLTHDQLEARRLYVLEEAQKVAEQKRELERSMREYQSAHGLTPMSKQPSKIGLVRNRGRDLNDEIARDGRAKSIATASASVLSDRPVYDSPAKNLRAADAAVAELSNLTGDEKQRQQLRINELIHAATQQQAAFDRAYPGYGSAMYSVGGAGAKSLGHAASSPPGRNRAASVNSSKKNKQLQAYDPAFAGKQIADRKSVV